MEMLLIITATLFLLLLKSPEVNGEFFHSNNLIKKGDRHPATEEFVKLKKEYEDTEEEKWGLERIGDEISVMRSQMRSMLQMVELQAVVLQTLRDQASFANTIVHPDVVLKSHILIGRRYWRRLRRELRTIRECSCRPIASVSSDAMVGAMKREVFENITTNNRILPENDVKNLSSSSSNNNTNSSSSSSSSSSTIRSSSSTSGVGAGSDSIDDSSISTRQIDRNLGSSDVFELPDSTDKSNHSVTKVTPIETNQLPGPTIGNIQNGGKKNKTVPFNNFTSVDDESYDVKVDLTTGIVHGKSAEGLTWLLHPSQPKKRKSDWSAQCGLQSVLKLSFSPPAREARELESKKFEHERKKLLIDLWFQKPHKWIFNIGDSSSNDGLSGDGTTQQNDCEAEGYGNTFNIYRSDKAQDPFKKLLYQKKGFLKHRVTFIVSDQTLFWNNHNGNINSLNDSTLFALNGQSDSQGRVNFDIYLALNRVISGDYRSGHGLCRAALKWIL